MYQNNQYNQAQNFCNLTPTSKDFTPCKMGQNSSPQYSVFSTASSRNSDFEDSTGKKNFNNETFDHNAKLAFVSAFED